MKKTLTLVTTVTAALGLAVAGNASAQAQISTQSIIVNPTPTNLSVQVWTDRDTSGSRTPNYVPGERIRLFTKVNQDAYVYLFNVDPNGEVVMILPNRFSSGGNFLKAGQTRAFPANGDQYVFDIAAPYGVNKVLALASRTQLNMNQIATFQSQSGFATSNVSGQRHLAEALSIVVNPLPKNNWVTDTAFYNVARPNSNNNTAPVQQVAPTVNVPYPNFNQQVWRANFNGGNLSLQQAHDQYLRILRENGYRIIETRSNSNRFYTSFDGNQTIGSLMIQKNGSNFDVRVVF